MTTALVSPPETNSSPPSGLKRRNSGRALSGRWASTRAAARSIAAMLRPSGFATNACRLSERTATAAGEPAFSHDVERPPRGVGNNLHGAAAERYLADR